jgi:hypothetical protein
MGFGKLGNLANGNGAALITKSEATHSSQFLQQWEGQGKDERIDHTYPILR